jgi:hypothetical protein
MQAKKAPQNLESPFNTEKGGNVCAGLLYCLAMIFQTLLGILM